MPATPEAEARGSYVQIQPGQYGETPVSKKKKKKQNTSIYIPPKQHTNG